MTVCRVENKYVGSCRKKRAGSVKHIGSYAYSCAAKKSAAFVFCGIGIFCSFLNVLYRYKSAEISVLIYKRKLFNLPLGKYFSCLFMCCADGSCNQVIFSHDLAYVHAHIRKETHIAVCDYTYKLSFAVHYRNAGDFIIVHKLFGFINFVFGMEEERICNYAVFASLYLFNLTCLHINRHIFMDYTYSAFSRHRYRKLGLRNRVHSGRNKRSIEPYLSGKSC